MDNKEKKLVGYNSIVTIVLLFIGFIISIAATNIVSKEWLTVYGFIVGLICAFCIILLVSVEAVKGSEIRLKSDYSRFKSDLYRSPRDFSVIFENGKPKLTRDTVYKVIKVVGDEGITFSELVDVFYKPVEGTHKLTAIIVDLVSDTWITRSPSDSYTSKHRSEEDPVEQNDTPDEKSEIDMYDDCDEFEGLEDIEEIKEEEEEESESKDDESN